MKNPLIIALLSTSLAALHAADTINEATPASAIHIREGFAVFPVTDAEIRSVTNVYLRVGFVHCGERLPSW